MGYDVHITRKEAWYDEDGPDISREEWLAYVADDPEMRLDGHAEATLDGGTILRVDDPSMAVWIGHPDNSEVMAWIWHWNGSVMAKNPDDAILRKMHRIAEALKARLQGDEGEFYGPDGDVLPGGSSSAAPSAAPNKKPWWRFWP